MKDSRSKVERMTDSEVLKFIEQNDHNWFVESCEHGHLGCSNTYMGPCFDEACYRECYLMKSQD